jgi:hypothetical protein
MQYILKKVETILTAKTTTLHSTALSGLDNLLPATPIACEGELTTKDDVRRSMRIA